MSKDLKIKVSEESGSIVVDKERGVWKPYQIIGVLMQLVNYYAIKYEHDDDMVMQGAKYAGNLKILENEKDG